MAQHQRELSGLQTVQSEQLNSLTQRHQHEVDQLQSKINELERTASGSHVTRTHSDEKEEGAVMKLRCVELEEEVKKLTRKIGELERSSRSNTDGVKEQLQQLSSQNTKLREVNGQLESQLRKEQVSQWMLGIDFFLD